MKRERGREGERRQRGREKARREREGKEGERRQRGREERGMSDYEEDYESYSYGEGEGGGGGGGGRFDPCFPILAEGLIFPAAAMATGAIAGAAAGGREWATNDRVSSQ